MVWLERASRLRHWFSERHLVSYTVIAANTTGICFAIRSYIKEHESEQVRRQDQEAMASLDRAATFSNARLPERSVVELESYRWQIEAEESARVKKARRFNWLMGGNSSVTEPREWANVWIERRCALDRTAAEMDARRLELKNLWYVAKQAW